MACQLPAAATRPLFCRRGTSQSAAQGDDAASLFTRAAGASSHHRVAGRARRHSRVFLAGSRRWVRAARSEPHGVADIDVVVFNHQLTLRALFHALVHCAQIQILGVEGYSELWVESFVENRSHFTVPLEVHAFSLASRFLSPLAERFSVEEQILRWRDDGRY